MPYHLFLFDNEVIRCFGATACVSEPNLITFSSSFRLVSISDMSCVVKYCHGRHTIENNRGIVRDQ